MGTDVGRADPGAPGVDLSHCEREPVHIPGAVQPHGALLVLDPSELRIVAASDNTERILGLVADRLIGLGLPEISDTAEHRALVESLRRPNPTDRNPHPWTLAGGRGFDVVAHVHDGRLLVEFEPRGPDPRFAHIERDVLAGLGRLHAASSLQDLCERTAREMRRLTGFDRVLIYAFEADGVGEVVAEESHDGQTRYLGLRFPASDIPSQARALYSACRLRMIPSSSYAPSKVIGLHGERPLDLTHAVLRSISPVHLEYMRNMGVTASLGISLMREGRLWGLITCNHESGDLSLPHPARAALALLGEVVSTWIVAKEETHGEARAAFLHVQSELVQRVLQGRDVVGGLTRQSPSILDVAHCGGAALRYENEIHVVGATPPASAIDALLAWIETQDTQTFVSHSLPAQY
ncbi:MAG: GAF domain-containing protein, partial [Deltaproteobacteria bacterium]|nr:GAF domain-containing protein [Nannocystaceae bacterium]